MAATVTSSSSNNQYTQSATTFGTTARQPLLIWDHQYNSSSSSSPLPSSSHTSPASVVVPMADIDQHVTSPRASAVVDINESAISMPSYKLYFPLSVHHRELIGGIVKAMMTKVIVFIAVFIDAIILIVETSSNSDSLNEGAINGITITILVILLLECFLRIAYLDIIGFFKDPWSIFDFLVTIISFISFLTVNDFGRYLVLMRLARLSRVVWLVYRQQKGIKASARQLVSQNRRRFNKDGFDIDITYVTDRIIAMSVPAVAVEAMYRNPVGEVARFFNTKHTDHYRIVNLCPERQYPYHEFNGRIIESYMGDHNPAPLEQILDVCKQVDQFLGEHKDNIVAYHCKGGKGRTGTMICSYLLYSGMLDNAEDAMEFFALRRTSDQGEREGIEAKSQERFVRYIGAICATKGALHRQLPLPHALIIRSIRIHGISLIHTDPLAMWFCLYQGMMTLLYNQMGESNRGSTVIHNRDGDYVDYLLSVPLRLLNDIRVAFYLPKVKGGKVKSTLDKLRGKNTTPIPTPVSSHDATPTSPSSPSSSSSATPTDVTITIGHSGNHNSNSSTGAGVPLIPHVNDDQHDESSLPITVSHHTKHSDTHDEKKAPTHDNGNGVGNDHHRTKSSVTKMKDNKKAFGFWFHTSFVVARHLHLQRNEIDGVKKDKTGRFASLAIDVYFE